MESTPSARLRNTGLSLSAGANVALLAAGATTPKPTMTRHPEPEPQRAPEKPTVSASVGGRAIEAVLIADSAIRLVMAAALRSNIALSDEITTLLMAASSATGAAIPGECSPAEAHVRFDVARDTIGRFLAQEDAITCTACDGHMIKYTDRELICDTCGTTAPRGRGGHR